MFDLPAVTSLDWSCAICCPPYDFSWRRQPLIRGSALRSRESGDADSDGAKIIELIDAVTPTFGAGRLIDKEFLMRIEDIFSISCRVPWTGRLDAARQGG